MFSIDSQHKLVEDIKTKTVIATTNKAPIHGIRDNFIWGYWSHTGTELYDPLYQTCLNLFNREGRAPFLFVNHTPVDNVLINAK